MIEVLKLAEKLIVTDTQVKNTLSKYGKNNKPAFFDELAPEDAKCPYIVVSSKSTPNNIGVDTMLYEVDVYDDNATSARLLGILDRVEYLFFHASEILSEAKDVSITRGLKFKLPDETMNTYHGHVEFNIRYGRKALYNV